MLIVYLNFARILIISIIWIEFRSVVKFKLFQ